MNLSTLLTFIVVSVLILTSANGQRQNNRKMKCYNRLMNGCAMPKVKREMTQKMNKVKAAIGRCIENSGCLDPMCAKDEAFKVMQGNQGCNLGPEPSDAQKRDMKIGMAMKMMKKMATKLMTEGVNPIEMMSKKQEMSQKIVEKARSFCERPEEFAACVEEVVGPKMQKMFTKLANGIIELEGGTPVRGLGSGAGGNPSPAMIQLMGRLGQVTTRRSPPSEEEMPRKMAKLFQIVHKKELKLCKKRIIRNKPNGLRCQQAFKTGLNNRQLDQMIRRKKQEHKQKEQMMGQKLSAVCDCVKEELGPSDYAGVNDAVQSTCGGPIPDDFDSAQVFGIIEDKMCSKMDGGDDGGPDMMMPF